MVSITQPILQHSQPMVIAAHSLGCIALAHWQADLTQALAAV